MSNFTSYNNASTLLTSYADAINRSLKFKTTTETDADDIISETGMYIVNTSEIANLPTSEASMEYILEVRRTDSETTPSAVIQIAYRGEVESKYPLYIRRYDGTTWSTWRGLQTSDLCPSTFVGTQAEWDALSSDDKSQFIIVDITDDTSSGSEGGTAVVKGYYNPDDGKFYFDSSYTTEITPDPSYLYIDLNENKIYRYDSTEAQYIAISGSGGANYVAGYGIKIDTSTNEISAKTFVGTQAEWNALTTEAQEEFDSVNITDDATPIDYEPGHAIVDSTGTEAPQRNNLKFNGMTVADDSANDTTVVAPIPYTAGDKITITDHEIAVNETVTTTFTGTRAEWEALSSTEKAAYTIVNLTDDPAGSGMVVVDVIADGNMNAVTSNAVHDILRARPMQVTESRSGSGTITFSLTYRQPTLIFVAPWSGGGFGLYMVWPDVINQVTTVVASEGVSTISYDWASKVLTVTVNRSVSISLWYCQI